MVLLKNEGVLPLDLSSLGTVVVCGPNAERPQMMGGGSANLAPHYRISPLDALRAGAPRDDPRGCAGLDRGDLRQRRVLW